MKQRVVIIGIGYTSRLGLIRAIGKADYEVYVIVVEKTNKKPIDCYSKYVKRSFFSQGNDEEKILDIIKNQCVANGQKAILIPVNDFSASVLDRNYNKLNENFLLPHIHGEEGAITKWMNKELQKKLAQSVGLNVANSVNVEITNRGYKFPPNILYPCFTKTCAYVPGYKQTLFRCDSEKELRDVLDSLCSKYENITVLVEDYMEIEREYAVVGVSNGKEVFIPGVIEIISMGLGSDKGVANQGIISPIGNFSDLIRKFEQFIKKIGFVGLFDIDFYKCNDKFYFGELNLRIGGSSSAIIKMGVNLPVLLVKLLLGESMNGMQKYITSSSHFVNERICTESWYNGYIKWHDFSSFLKYADISFVKDSDDIEPEKQYAKRLKSMRVKRILKELLCYLRFRKQVTKK